jgi:hypothetical protein
LGVVALSFVVEALIVGPFIPSLLAALVLFGIAYLLGTKVKRVFLDDGELIVRDLFTENRIPFERLSAVSDFTYWQWQIVTIKYSGPEESQQSVTFQARTLWLTWNHPIVEELGEIVAANHEA